MGIIVWLIVGGVCGWLASMIMRTDAQQGVRPQRHRRHRRRGDRRLPARRRRVAQQQYYRRELPLFAARRGRPAGDRQPGSPRLGPVT